MKINDIIGMSLGMLGLALAFYENELFFGELKWDKSGSQWTFTVEEEQY